MQYKVYDNEAARGTEMDLEELVARLTTLCTTGLGIWTHEKIELCKAYAVLIRTDLARRLDIYEGKGCSLHEGYHVCTLPGHCLEHYEKDIQVPEIIMKAARETALRIVTFNDRPIKPYYHFRCGGSTDNSENVLGRRITYLRRVLCNYCKDEDDECTIHEFDKKELEKKLGIKFEENGRQSPDIKGLFEDIDVDDQGRILSIRIGGRLFKGNELMDLLGLESTRFGYAPTRFLFVTKGKGHGLGLCQCGALQMAGQGRTCDEILRYYFTGVEIKEMELPEQDKRLKGRKFVLDAAFGGQGNDGAVGLGGLKEKDVNLDIVLKLKELLESKGAHVYLTRQTDCSVPLDDRAKLGNTIKPHFFISIQQNTFCNSSARGAEIYHYRDDAQGAGLAQAIMQEFDGTLKIKTRGVRTAEFYILREVRVSALLIQPLYISNPEDEELLGDEAFRTKTAEAVCNGITEYFLKGRDL